MRRKLIEVNDHDARTFHLALWQITRHLNFLGSGYELVYLNDELIGSVEHWENPPVGMLSAHYAIYQDDLLAGRIFTTQRKNSLTVDVRWQPEQKQLGEWLIAAIGNERDQIAPAPVSTQTSLANEEHLRVAIYNIEAKPSTPAWWSVIAQLYNSFKTRNPRYTYAKLAALLSMDEKHVGKMIRKHHPKTP